MMEGGFNTGFVEIRTLEGEKFLKDIRINEAVKTRHSYTLANGLHVREMKPRESVFPQRTPHPRNRLLTRPPMHNQFRQHRWR